MLRLRIFHKILLQIAIDSTFNDMVEFIASSMIRQFNMVLYSLFVKNRHRNENELTDI